jgi:hypothetical protein
VQPKITPLYGIKNGFKTALILRYFHFGSATSFRVALLFAV